MVKLLKLKDTFEPYIDTFSRGALDVNGNPAATAEEVRHGLMQILSDLERHLGSEQTKSPCRAVIDREILIKSAKAYKDLHN